jgi:eukaryotic-like serine/threonine-protein kinase
MPPMTGRVIAGRYNLAEPIGRGAMGVVWRARDILLDREVAVKEVVLNAAIGEDERQNAYQRTLREARTAARLSHRGVVTVYDVAEEDGRPWIVMELVPSRSLEQVLFTDGPLSPRRAGRIGQQLLAALAAAHAAGVLHRDVKPSNVLIAPDGFDSERAVLTDFGIAQFEGDPRLTQTGMVMGSPGFTAPERIRGGSATPASDLWSLGATIYAAIEGRGPYEQRGGAITTMTAIINEDAPIAPSAGRLAPLIAALLRREPTARPSAARAARMFAEVLPMLPDHRTGSARRTPPLLSASKPAPPAVATSSDVATGAARKEAAAKQAAAGPALAGQALAAETLEKAAPQEPPAAAAEDETVASEAVSDPVSDAAAGPASDQPASDQPSADQPSADQLDADQPAAEQAAADQAAAMDAAAAHEAVASALGEETIASAGAPAASEAADESEAAAAPEAAEAAASEAAGAGNVRDEETVAIAAAGVSAATSLDKALDETPAEAPAEHVARHPDTTAVLPDAKPPVWASRYWRDDGEAGKPEPGPTFSARPAAPAAPGAPDAPGGQRMASPRSFGAPGYTPAAETGRGADNRPPARRRRSRVVAIVAVAVVVVIAAVVVLLIRPGGPPASAKAATGTSTTANGSQQSAVQAIDDPATKPPAGWSTQVVSASEDGTASGLSIGLPPGWQFVQQSAATYLYAPDGVRYLEIELTPHHFQNMVAEAKYIEQNSTAAGNLPGYQRLSIKPEEIRGTAGAIWSFTWVKRSGVPMRVDDLLFTLPTSAGPQSYAIYFTAPAAEFGTSQGLTLFNKILRTFEPSAD